MTNGTKIPRKVKGLFYKNRPNNIHGNSSFSVITECSHILNFTGMACFVHLKFIDYVEDNLKPAAYVAHYPYSAGSLRRQDISVTKYFDWLINRSPFHHAFPEQLLRRTVDTCLIVDASTPSNLMVAALIASRYPYEFPHIVKLMQDLVAKGVDENLAFLTAHGVNRYGKDGHIMPAHRIGGGGHQVLWGEQVNNLKAFITSDVSKYLLRLPYNKDKKYTGVHQLFTPAFVNQKGKAEAIREQISYVLSKAAKSKIDRPNGGPFAHKRKIEFYDDDSLKIIAAELSKIHKKIMEKAA